jgi:hypothetical protein
MVKFCLECGSQLSELRTSRAVFCPGGACKIAHWKRNQLAQAERAVQLLAPAPDSPSWRAMVAALENPDPRGSTWTDRLDYVIRTEPAIVESFGPAALRASARPIPAGVCRWCLADADARVHGSRRLQLSTATRKLLGVPCKQCLQRMRDEAAVRVDAARTPARGTPGQGTGRSAGSGSFTRAPRAGRPLHATPSCLTCHQAASGKSNRATLTASALPHEPRPPQSRHYFIRGCACADCLRRIAEHDRSA